MASGLSGRRVLLGVSGGIAAYKIPDLVRLLQKEGAEVRCVVTASAARLVSIATLAALTRHPVATETMGDDSTVYTRHIESAQWADLFLLAPATANTLANLAAGNASDPVALAYLCVQCPRILCPSMNTRMLEAPATRRNLSTLAADGALVLQPDDGPLACGETGPGRLPELPDIVSRLLSILAPKAERSLRILVTLGRTEEPIDDVRVITNHSSGRTGADIVRRALDRGHRVTAIGGPCEATIDPRADIVRVRTAVQMRDAAIGAWPDHDAAICAAAVADFRPASPAQGKIPASRGLDRIELVPNPDILAELCSAKGTRRVVGFALERDDLERGSQKLSRKGCDLAVCNDPLRDPDRGGFGATSTWAWIGPAGNRPEPAWMEKTDLAERIVSELESA